MKSELVKVSCRQCGRETLARKGAVLDRERVCTPCWTGTTYRGDAADRLAERDRFLREHGTHSLTWFDGDEEFGYFDGLACNTHEAELQLIPPTAPPSKNPGL